MWIKLLVIATAGALGAVLVNRNVAVFHDGLRPLMLERIQGRMPRREFVTLAFGLSFGLAAGFGLPFSLVSAILLNHLLWLGTDVIGVCFVGPRGEDKPVWTSNWLGMVGAGLAGAAYGGVLCLALEGMNRLFILLPVNMSDALQSFGTPILLTFSAFPAVAIAYRHGVVNGIVAFLITLLGRQAASTLGAAQPDLWALAVGMVVLVVYAVRQARQAKDSPTPVLLPMQRLRRVRDNLPAIALLGGVYGFACHQAIMMEGPQALIALALGDRATATGIALVRAVSFTPVKTMAALTTGVFAMDGLGFVAAVGLAAPNAGIAIAAGAVVMCAEALSLGVIGTLLQRCPDILTAVDSIRTGMTKMLELGSLVGGAMAAYQLAPGPGLFVIGGLFALNEAAGLPIARAAIGPVGFILVAIVVNLLALLHLPVS